MKKDDALAALDVLMGCCFDSPEATQAYNDVKSSLTGDCDVLQSALDAGGDTLRGLVLEVMADCDNIEKYMTLPHRLSESGWFKRAEQSLATPQGYKPQWINPHDKTQKQWLPWIGERVFFMTVDGDVFEGRHNGGHWQRLSGNQAVDNSNVKAWIYPKVLTQPSTTGVGE